MSPVFLTLDEVLEIHLDQIERYGGSAGLRDIGLLESALAAPAASFGGALLHADLFEMAAALLVGIVKNHAFVDGNKRVGAVAALVFLRMNDIPLTVSEDLMFPVVIDVATGKADKEAVAAFLRERSAGGA